MVDIFELKCKLKIGIRCAYSDENQLLFTKNLPFYVMNTNAKAALLPLKRQRLFDWHVRYEQHVYIRCLVATSAVYLIKKSSINGYQVKHENLISLLKIFALP